MFPLAAWAEAPALDSDGDGIPDALEQTLLDQFRPAFLVSARDCAAKPARFAPGVATPTVVDRDGTIYGQVSPSITNPGRIEIHYYTLWDRDCGRLGHPLDTEHVSALIESGAAGTWKAVYWYAGAHEDTVCDISSGTRSSVLSADERGPQVWASSGKHALFFRKELCGRGCGGDQCKDNVTLPVAGQVINIGERGKPMNEAVWIASNHWPLADKMDTDFSPEVIARIDASKPTAIVTVSSASNSTKRGMIQGADSALDGAVIGTQNTGAALDNAGTETSKSLGTALAATGRSLKVAWKAATGWMQPKTKPTEAK